jgi:hypothetical protein
MGWGVKNLVDIFNRNDLGLFGLLVEYRVGQRLAIVKDGHALFGIHANGNNCLAQ